MIDWSDAEANGLQKAVRDTTVANGLLKGYQVAIHWSTSYQRVADKLCRTATIVATIIGSTYNCSVMSAKQTIEGQVFMSR